MYIFLNILLLSRIFQPYCPKMKQKWSLPAMLKYQLLMVELKARCLHVKWLANQINFVSL